MPTEPVDLHRDAAELRKDVGAFGQRPDDAPPLGEHLVRLAREGTDAERAAEVIEDNGGLGKCACEIGQGRDLGVIAPALEREPARGEVPEPFAEPGVEVQVRPGLGAMIGHVRTLVPRGALPDAAKASAGRQDLAIQHVRRRIAQTQVRSADDASGDPRRTVLSRLAHRRDTGDELRLADRTKRFGAIGPEHRPALDKYRRYDVMAARQVLEKLVEEIARRDPVEAEVPQMMMRVADRQLRLEGRLDGARQPVVVRRHGSSVLVRVYRGA